MTDEHLLSTAAQTYLAGIGFYTDKIDGDWGVWSRAAAKSWWLQKSDQIKLTMDARARDFMGTPDANELRILAAQTFLKQKGIYGGAIDAQWGPVSTSAAWAWWAVLNPPPISDRPGQIPMPYDIAKRYLGVKEIPGKNHCGVILAWYRRLSIAVYDDETAWCSTFANECAMEAGYERSGKLNARSWLDVGIKIPLSEARIGCDVLIFERGSNGWSGHVTFYAGQDATRGTVRGLGGNQNDEVNITTYTTSKLLGVRRLRSLELLQGSSNKI